MNNLKQYAGLLNEVAPKGEFLAYINENESKMLKDAGAKGLLTPQGIPSYRGAGGYQGGSTSSGSSSSSSSSGSSSGSSSSGGGGGGGQDMGGGGGSQNYKSAMTSNAAYSTTTSTPSSTYDNAGIDMGNVDAEDEYLAPDPNHFKATQKAIGKTNKELRDQGLDKSDWTDYTKEEQDAYQLEMNKLNGTEGKNYSFYKGNKGTTNLTFGEHFKDVVVTNPVLKFSPTLRLLVAAGRTLKENFTTDYGTGKYGGYTADGMGSGQPIDQGGWLGRVFNSDGSVNENLTEGEANDIYNQIQPDLPFIIGDTEKPDSMVDNYFANLNNTNLGISENYLNTYNAAKTKMANTLNMTPPNQQFGYGNTYNDTYARKMNNTNVFYNYLNEQGLI
jgi:hypothetical protein